MNLLCDPILLKFERNVDGTIETVLEADLVELYSGFCEALGANHYYHQAAKPFAAWIKKNLNVVITTTQAEIIARKVDEEYKKKFASSRNGQTLPTSSGSILSDSTQD